jgi:hypothetical protein
MTNWITDGGVLIEDQPDLVSATRAARELLGPDVYFGISMIEPPVADAAPIRQQSPNGTWWVQKITDSGRVQWVPEQIEEA